MTVQEQSIAALQALQTDGKLSAQTLQSLHCQRIEAINTNGPQLRAVLELNPDAASIAEQLDTERQSTGPRSGLHGIAILLKDNIDSGDAMLTSAGSLALADQPAPEDATLVTKLRDAGVVLIGKTNLSEWANFRSTRSSSGWSSRGGQTRNPYALDRTPSGSSSGSAVAVAAGCCTAAIGTETDGSIVSPAAANGIVGFKPTVGLISRCGIVPIAHSQDTAGPMTRCVADAAALLTVMNGPDPDDPVTMAASEQAAPDYTAFLDRDSLRGARLGVARQFCDTSQPSVDLLAETINRLRAAGAIVVDPVVVETADALRAPELIVLEHEFKTDLNHYLATRRPQAKVKSLADIIAFNAQNSDRVMPFFGQERMLGAEQTGGLDAPNYRRALQQSRQLAAELGIDATCNKHRLDAIVSLTASAPWLIDWVCGDRRGSANCSSPAAVAGYPHITVPCGQIRGLPIGMSFFASAFAEPRLIGLAYAFEQLTQARTSPSFADSASFS